MTMIKYLILLLTILQTTHKLTNKTEQTLEGTLIIHNINVAKTHCVKPLIFLRHVKMIIKNNNRLSHGYRKPALITKQNINNFKRFADMNVSVVVCAQKINEY